MQETPVRPSAIIWFERLYLAALAIKTAFAVLNWQLVHAGGVQISLIVNLLLWYGIVHRHSNIARWIVIALFLVSACYTFATSPPLPAANAVEMRWVISTAIILALSAIATGQLLRPSVEPWFSGAKTES